MPFSLRPRARAAACALGLTFLAALLVSLRPVALAAQDTPPRKLTAPSQEFAEGFTTVNSVAELDDDLVLVSDWKDAEVLRLRWSRGEQDGAARRGRGPTEYDRPGGLYRMRNGEIWLLDQTQRRYLVFNASGRAVRTEPFAAGQTGSMILSNSDPHRLDGRAREIGRAHFGREGPTADSPLLRRSAERLDTLAMLRNPEMTQNATAGARVMATVRFSPADGFAVGADGDVAVVRAEPYHVEWFLANGRRLVGPPVAFTPVAVTDDDRKIAESMRSSATGPSGMRITQTDANGQRREVNPMSLIPELRMAATKPAFDPTRLFIDPVQRLWVGRHTAVGAAELYDIFDRGGRRIDRVELPSGFKLVGFGNDRLYVVREDADGLQWLGRIPYSLRAGS